MMSPQTLTKRAVAQAKAKNERGYMFPLPHTAGVWEDGDPDMPEDARPGHARAIARVRKLHLHEVVNLVGLTSSMRETVLEVLRQSGGDDAAKDAFKVRTWDDVERNRRKQDELANGLCMLGWIEPKLVATEEEATAGGENVLCVEEIDLQDRIAYMNSIFNENSEAAKQMRPFPETGLRHPDVGQVVPFTAHAEQPAAYAGSGSQPAGVSGL